MSSGDYWRTILALLQERISDLLMGAMTRPIWRKWLLLFIASLKGYISSTQVYRESEKFCFLTQNFLFHWSLWPFLIFWLKLKNMHLIWQEASKSKNGKAPHAAWCNYDDLNEYFWLDHRFCFSYCFVISGKGWWTNCAPSLFHILFYFVITTNNMFQVTWLFHFGLAYEWQCRVLQVYPWSYSYSTGETSLFSATICFFDINTTETPFSIK